MDRDEEVAACVGFNEGVRVAEELYGGWGGL